MHLIYLLYLMECFIYASGDKIHAPKIQGRAFFWGSRSAAGSCDTDAKGFGGPEIVNNYKIQKMHAPKIQGCVFCEGAEEPQAAATQPQRAWGALESLNNQKITRYRLQSSRGVSFLRSPKRRRQLRHRRTGLGDHETGKPGNFPVDIFNIFLKCRLFNM